MISVGEAQNNISAALQTLGNETCALEDAAERILAQSVCARLTQPPFAASAMDGYAVRFADAIQEDAKLRVIGTSSAGERFAGDVKENCAVRIYTGAPLPEGADHIVIQEHVLRDGDIICVKEKQTAPKHIRPAGIDFKEGDELIAAGARLNGPALTLAAAANFEELAVRRKPRIALIANGDELIMPGGARTPDQIICSIPYGLAPMIKQWGGSADFLGIAPDDPTAIAKIVERALDYDLIVPIGGASVGDRDYMRSVFQEFGYGPIFEKVSVKPGKPAWFGAVKKTHVLGLPGNPASAMVTAILFVKPAIEAMLGVPNRDLTFSAPLASALSANGPRESYLRAKLSRNAEGVQTVMPLSNQDSSLMSVFSRADVLLQRLSNAPAANPGDMATCLAI